MQLSICLLTRDAEGKIERALRSVAGLGAEVIVGDTGSKDATVQRARELGAQVQAIHWRDDFAAAQNEVLAVAMGEWVLWLNPDEELLPASKDPLPALLTRADALAYMVRIEEISRSDTIAGNVETLAPRLYRRHPELRYVGRLHPHFVVPLEEMARRLNQHVYAADLVVRHHAYLSVLTPDKLRWATRLLELELGDRPGQLHYLIEYGRNLLRLNDPKGHTILAEAAEQVARVQDAPAAPTPTVASLLEYLLTVAPEQAQGRLGADFARGLALRWFPTSPPLFWVLAQRAFQANDFREAAGLLERLVELGRTGRYDRSAAFDPSIIGEAALVNLGSCYIRLGQLERAEACFGPLLSSPTHQEQARRGYALIQELRRKGPPAR